MFAGPSDWSALAVENVQRHHTHRHESELRKQKKGKTFDVTFPFRIRTYILCFVLGGYLAARIRLPNQHSYYIELTLAPTSQVPGIEVVPNLLHLTWKTRTRKNEQQNDDGGGGGGQQQEDPVLSHEWRLLMKKEGDRLQRYVHICSAINHMLFPFMRIYAGSSPARTAPW